MSKRPSEVDPRRLQGIPRVRWVQAPKTSTVYDADDAIFLASKYRLVPDAWQVDIIHSWMRRGSDGTWVHPRCGLACPRQNGKNGALEVRELYGLIYLHEGILHTAHLVDTSRKAFKKLQRFFGEKADDPNANFPELNALVADVRSTNGQEAIVLKDLYRVDGVLVRSVGRPAGRDIEYVARGGFIDFSTRTGAGGRGNTYDLLVVDEAQHLSEEDLEAIRPTISHGPLGNSQVIYLGTPPDPEKLKAGFGEAWTRIRRGARKSKDLAWVEYGAPDGPMPDIFDMELLYSCNPSLEVRHGNGSHGLSLKTIEGEREDLSPAGLARERFGWWGNPEAKSHRGVIDMTQWKTLRVAGDDVPVRGLIVVDVSPDLEWTSVAVATDGPDGRPLGIVDRQEGTGWAVDRVKQLKVDLDETLEVALTPTAKMFAAALTKAKVEFKQLTVTDVGAACMATQQMIRNAGLAHVGQPVLDAAAKAAITKYSGETQQWDRRDPKVDISALVAFSVAVHRWPIAIAARKKVGTARRAGTAPAIATTQTQRRRSGARGGFNARTSRF